MMKIVSILMLAIICTTGAATAQTTQPAQGRGALIRNRIERFRANLASLDLTSEQREKANALLQDTVEKLKDLANDADPASRQAKFREAMQDLRSSLSTILTPEQLQELRQKMQQNNGPAAPNQPTTAPSAQSTGTMMQDDSGEKAGEPVVDKTGSSASTPIETGKPAPDFKLFRLDGTFPIQLSAMKGHVVVLIFGSYTCPTFRDRAGGLNRLYRDLQGKANIFLVYTREAHPSDGWEIDRNKQENIDIQQPTEKIGRNAIARHAHDALHLEMPILMDEMDDAVTAEYGGFPNAAVVVDRNGVIFGTEQWAEPTALRHMIEEAVGGK